MSEKISLDSSDISSFYSERKYMNLYSLLS